MLEFPLDDLAPATASGGWCGAGSPFRTDVYEVGGHMIWGATARILGDLLASDGIAIQQLVDARVAASQASRRPGRRQHLERDLPASPALARAIASPSGSVAFVDDAAHRRVDELLPQHPQPAGVQVGRRGIVPISQQTIVTPCSASISVAIRSGSPT